MIIDELIAILGYDVKGEDNLRHFNDGLDRTQKKAEAAAARINAINVAVGTFFGDIASRITMRVGSAIGSLPGEMTSTAADFESMMTGIQKKAGATADQMKAIGKEILDLAMGGELASSIDDIAAAYERGAAAGLPLDDLREFALLSTKAADAFEMSAEATGNAFVGFQKVLGVAGGDLERVADLINYLADSGIADERDIVAFMDSAGALAKTVGFSVEETAALGAALVNLKIPAGEAATAMNSVLTKLIAPQAMSKEARTAFQAVAGDVNAFAKAMSEDADGALVGLLEKLSQLDSSARAGAIANIFGLNHADVVQQLVSGVDELKRNLSEAKNEAAWLGSLQSTYAMKLDDFWSKSQRFWNNTKGVLTIMGERVLPIFGEALDDVSDYIHTIAFDGSLDAIADGFERLLRSGRDFVRHIGVRLMDVGKGAYYAADAIVELISKVTGLNKAASAGILGAAVLGHSKLGRAAMVALAKRIPALAALLLADDIIGGLKGEDSYIGKLKGGEEALASVRKNFTDLKDAADELVKSFDKIFHLEIGGFLAHPLDFINDSLVDFIRELGSEIERLTNVVRLWNELSVGAEPGVEPRWSPKNFDNSLLGRLLGRSSEDEDRISGGKSGRLPQNADGAKPQSFETRSGPAGGPILDMIAAIEKAGDKQDTDVAVARPDVEQPMPTSVTSGIVSAGEMIRTAIERASAYVMDGAVNYAVEQAKKGDRVVSQEPDPARFGDFNAPKVSGMDQLRAMLENMNANLAKMTPESAVNATVTDARQDNRQFPVTVNSTVNQTVTQPSAAPAAAARATGDAVGQAAARRASRFEMGPVSR